MADLKKVVSDPDFMALPISEQVKGLSELDPDFGGLDPSEQVKGLKEMRTSPSMFKNFVLGVGKGLSDPIQGLKQRGAEIGETLGFVSPQEAQNVQESITARDNTFKSLAGDSTSAKLGQVAGDVAGTTLIPGGLGGSLLKRMLTGAAGGAASGFLQPTADDESVLGKTLGLGSAGALGGAIFGGKRKIVNAVRGNIYKPNEVVAGIRGISSLGKVQDLTRQQIADLSKKYDIGTTYGEATGSKFGKSMEIIGERFPGWFGINQFRKRVAEAADTAANNRLMQYMVDPNAPDVMAGNRAFVSSMYEDMKNIISNVPIQAIKPDETKIAAKQFLSRYPDIFNFSQDAKMKGILSEIVSDTKDIVRTSNILSPGGKPYVTVTPRTLTFDEAWLLREGLGDVIGQMRQKIASKSGELNKNQLYQANKLFSAVSRDMDNWADSIGQPAIKHSFKAANDAYKHYVVKYDLLQKAYDNAVGVTGKGEREFFSPKVFSNELKKMVYLNKELKTFSPNELTEMAGLANIMQVVKRSGQYAAQQNNGIQTLTLGVPLSVGATAGGIVGGGLPGAALGAVAVGFGAGALRFLTATKPGKALLMAASHIEPDSYTAKMLINTIERQAPRAVGYYFQGGTE